MTGASAPSNPVLSNRIFIVHGHDGAREAVARFVSQIGLEPVILHEMPNKGRTTIEKFEHHADVGFAVVVLTPDDVGKLKDEDSAVLRPRARQNVIMELGYFIGRLTRRGVCALQVGDDIELPSDILGVVWTPFDAGWKLALAKELKAAGYTIDWSALGRGS